MANINELLTGFGFNKQADIVTPSVAASIWRLNNLQRKPWAQQPMNEDDSQEVGKGHEFATALYKSHYDPPAYTLEKYCSAEMLAWALSFGLGKVVKSGTTPNFTYTITPIAPATDGLELPYFTFVQQMRPGASVIVDQAFIGCAVKAFRLSLKNSPGRASAMVAVDLVTSGKYADPSTITLPAPQAVHEMNAGGLTLTINGIDYVTAKNFLSLEMGWDNAFRSGFYPGSGSQDGYQIQGRFEVGDRVPSCSFVARFANGSTELTKLKALTTGTAVITLTNDTNNNATITWQKVAFKVAELGETDGIVTVAVTCSPMYDSTNGILSAVVKCAFDGICQAAS